MPDEQKQKEKKRGGRKRERAAVREKGVRKKERERGENVTVMAGEQPSRANEADEALWGLYI